MKIIRAFFITALIVLCGYASAHAAETALTFDNYNHEYPEYSPDGNWIAYQKFDATGYYQIYKISAGGGPETQLTSSPYNHQAPQWAPDSSTIVYSVAWPPDRIAVVPVGGGPETYLTGTDQPRLYPSFSPDGSKISYNKALGGGNAQVFVIPSIGGSETQLTFGDPSGDAKWSLDGNWIAYIKEIPIGSGIMQIYKISSAGGPEIALTSDLAATHNAFSWSPNNSFISYRRLVGLYFQIFYIASTGGAENQLTSDSYIHGEPRWSQNSQFLCYPKRVGSFYQLFILPRTGGSEIQITSDTFNHFRPKFSNDGTKLIYQKQDSTGFWQIYTADFVPPAPLIPTLSETMLFILGLLLLSLIVIKISGGARHVRRASSG